MVDEKHAGELDRRQFLQKVSAGAVAAAGAPSAVGAAAPQAGTMPMITLGKYRLSRLILGSNPISGYAHSTRNLARHMVEYFTLERTIELVSRCEKAGINTWQSGHDVSKKIGDALRTLRERGSKVHWFCLARKTSEKKFKETLALNPIAMVHHGGVTDSLFYANKHEQVHDYVKQVHDAGIMAGISSHNPRHIAYAEEKGWENDFFMTCLYNVTRRKEEIREKLGTAPLGEPYFESDPQEMTEVVQQVKKPCLAFKILAAGRLCGNPKSVENAFKYAFSRIKKTDGVIVGMYPKFSDEVAHNVKLTLQYGA
jgi:hypothetical protein